MHSSPRARIWLTAFAFSSLCLFLVSLNPERRVLLPSVWRSPLPHRNAPSAQQRGSYDPTGKHLLKTNTSENHVTLLPSADTKARPQIQYNFDSFSLWKVITGGREKPEKVKSARDQIKQAFQRSWQGYRDQAWGYDEVAPVLGGYRDSHGGWAITLISSLDTLWIMGLRDEFHEAIEEVGTLNFTCSLLTHMPLDVIASRVLGGLLGAHDVSDGRYPVLLKQAELVGDLLLDAFNTSNGMPTKYLDARKDDSNTPHRPDQMTLTELSSLSLEFTRLSQLTGRLEFYSAIDRVLDALDEMQPHTTVPGLWPDLIDASGCAEEAAVDNGTVCQEATTLKSASDTTDDIYSLSVGLGNVYSSILKLHLLLGKTDGKLRQMYARATSAMSERLFFYPLAGSGAPSMMMAGNVIVDKSKDRAQDAANDDNDGNGKLETTFEPVVSRSACSSGAMLALGSRAIKHGWGLSTARKLTKGCIWGHTSSRSGVMPAEFVMMQCNNVFSCGWGGSEFHEWWNQLDFRRLKNFDPDNYLPDFDFDLKKRRKEQQRRWLQQKKRRRRGRQDAAQEGDDDSAEDMQTDVPSVQYSPLLSQTVSRPTPVLAHEDFVRERVWEEGLAEGMVDILSREYDLESETAESLLTLYRVTGDESWRDAGWKIFDALDRMTASRYGNARLVDTTIQRDRNADAWLLVDKMQAWWLSATLKYFYLLFSDSSTLSLDEFVFNTEGHPLRQPR